MNDDVAAASVAFFAVFTVLLGLVAYSFFMPIASATQAPWTPVVMRALAHFVPVMPPLVVGVALRYRQVWAWYLGVVYLLAMFVLVLFLLMEYLVLIAHGYLAFPTFLLLSLVALPSLILMLKGNARLLSQLRFRREE